MAAAAGDPAFEEQPSIRVVENQITGSFSPKETRLSTFTIFLHHHTWNRRRARPQAGLRPTIRNPGRLIKHQMRRHIPGTVRHEAVQFLDTRACAWAFGMRKHNHGWADGIERYLGCRGPFRRRRACTAVGVLEL